LKIGPMRLIETPEAKLRLSDALRQMSDALGILDEVNAPAEIGNTLDLAVARLEQYLGTGSHRRSAGLSLFEQLQRELAVITPSEPEKPIPWDMSPTWWRTGLAQSRDSRPRG
jgi:hypothetical protein